MQQIASRFVPRGRNDRFFLEGEDGEKEAGFNSDYR
jgi:hypothetical protein